MASSHFVTAATKSLLGVEPPLRGEDRREAASRLRVARVETQRLPESKLGASQVAALREEGREVHDPRSVVRCDLDRALQVLERPVAIAALDECQAQVGVRNVVPRGDPEGTRE